MSEREYLIAKAERERDRTLGRKIAGAGLATIGGGIALRGHAIGRHRKAVAGASKGGLTGYSARLASAKAVGQGAAKRGAQAQGVGADMVVGGGAVGGVNMIMNRRADKKNPAKAV